VTLVERRAMVAAPDASSNGSADSGRDAGSSPSVSDDTIATIGTACAREADKACTGHGQVDKLVCSARTWISNGSCDGNNRCDTMPGTTQGTCQPMAPACVGKTGGAVVCDGMQRKRCDADLLRYESDDCPGNMHCDASSGTMCTCDAGYEDDGAGGCNNIDDCAANACGAGATACADGVDSHICTCAPGYAGTGTNACADIDECMQSNVCTSDYPCTNTVPGYDCVGQLADWPMPDNSPEAKTMPSYTISADGLAVMDNVTGLMWQHLLPTSYDGCTGGTTAGTACTWSEAKSYCANLILSSHDDWRLPTEIELESILDVTKPSPAIDTSIFPSATVYWTSSPYLVSVFILLVGAGNEDNASPSGQFSVLCVRTANAPSGADPSDRYTLDAASVTVTDNRTGLTWQRSVDPVRYTWDQAKSYCQGLLLAAGGWRLPTYKELLTLVDPTNVTLSIDAGAFPGTPAGPPEDAFWSSSPSAG
jgi:hypothetical protein